MNYELLLITLIVSLGGGPVGSLLWLARGLLLGELCACLGRLHGDLGALALRAQGPQIII